MGNQSRSNTFVVTKQFRDQAKTAANAVIRLRDGVCTVELDQKDGGQVKYEFPWTLSSYRINGGRARDGFFMIHCASSDLTWLGAISALKNGDGAQIEFVAGGGDTCTLRERKLTVNECYLRVLRGKTAVRYLLDYAIELVSDPKPSIVVRES